MLNKKSIIIYFSRADENYGVGYVAKGNTEVIAEYIKELTNADTFKVERKVPYAKDYQTCTEEAKIESENDERPEVVNMLDSIDDYEVIYIGGPVYWGVLPQPMVTVLEKLNWQGKIVCPFTTHEGSGLGSVPDELNKLCRGAEIKKGLAIYGTQVYSAKQKVEDWLNEIDQ